MKYLLKYNDEFFALEQMSICQEWALHITVPCDFDGVGYSVRHNAMNPKEPTTLATTHLMDCFENIIPNVESNDELQEMLRRIGASGVGYIKFKNQDLQVGLMYCKDLTGKSWDDYFTHLYKPRKNKPSKRERNHSIN